MATDTPNNHAGLEAVARNINKEGFAEFFLEYSTPDYWNGVLSDRYQPLPADVLAAWEAFVASRDALAAVLEAHGVTRG